MIDTSVTLLCDDVAQLIDLHGESAILGDELLAIKRAGSGKGLAKLAIVTDFARVCDLVIRTANHTLSVHNSPAFPVIQQAANRLARSSRKEYCHFIHLDPEHLNNFLTVYRRDTGWFGSACVETAWSSLEICRRCVDLESNFGTLQRYATVTNGLITGLLGSSTTPLAVRAFVAFLDETVAEANDQIQSDGASQGKTNCSGVARSGENEDLENAGNAKEICVEWAGTKRGVKIAQEPISAPIVFDVHETPRMITIVLNSKHPLSRDLIVSMNDSNGRENGTVTSTAIHVLLEAWARLENKSGDNRRQLLEDIRLDWGRVARDILGGEFSNEV